ncbi:hypothetical protein K3175_00360 [Qipengyuania sp. GH1]|uniref:hypothetical protein n=1 Tax=Qipengyuania aestuarii TaxID=2867241 RepID=UPI001C87463D|nr:hypothetical protein [Qipengyuania aestuarii]MBX7534103.1 hypothetical protein [Qipengyuania aestuarii]
MALVACATTAAAVGLGPLRKSGLTASDRKGFYLTLTNPYPQSDRFRAYVDPESEIDPKRISILPETMLVGSQKSRKILVVVNDLTPGEEVVFRVCAERLEEEKVIVHVRVCSKLGARRIAPRPQQ